MGVGLCVPAMRYADDALACRPLPSTRLSPASSVVWADPTSHPRCPPLRLPLGLGSTGRSRGDGGISRVPRASHPCVPTAEAPVDAGPRSPGRAAAAAFPAVAYGSASTVSGISGLVPFMPACGGFRPTGFLSTLRPGRYRTGRKTRSQRGGGSPPRRWDSLLPSQRASHPLGSADLARRTQRPPLFADRWYNPCRRYPAFLESSYGCSQKRAHSIMFPICMRIIRIIKQPFGLIPLRSWRVYCRADNNAWWKRGSSSIGQNCWRTGTWLRQANPLTPCPL